MNGYFLSFLVFSPLLGLLVLSSMPKDQEKSLKFVGFLATLFPLILAIIAVMRFDQTLASDQFIESRDWIQFGQIDIIQTQLKIGYELGLSGLSLVLVLLTTLVTTLAAMASTSIKKEWKGYFSLFLLLETGMLGVFAAENLVLFFLFFEVTLVTMFFLIGKWGYGKREQAAFHFLIYNGIGSALLLITMALLFARTGTLNIAELTTIMSMPSDVLSQNGISDHFRASLAVLLLLAFGVKLPIFPLHRWMLRVHVEAPPAIVMIHSGILLKIGAYGLIRLGFGIFPSQFAQIALLLALLGVVNLIYGAILAFIQTDLKMVLAYSSISHMGIVLIGLAAMNEAGLTGAVFQVISHGLISTLLFLLIGVLYERTGTSHIKKLSGLAKVMPIASGIMLAGAMASLGLPGTSGFISEFMAFLGLFATRPGLAAIGTIGIILTAVYLLRAVLSVTFGKLNEQHETLPDMTIVESIPAVILIGVILLIGIYPDILAQLLDATVQTMMQRIGG